MSMNYFGKHILELRKELKKTQEEVARIINVDPTTYGGYERGSIMPPYDKISKIAAYYNVSIDYLMGVSSSREIDNPRDPITTYDFSSMLKTLIEELTDYSVNLTVNGVEIDDESRELLLASLESTIKIGNIISKSNSKG